MTGRGALLPLPVVAALAGCASSAADDPVAVVPVDPVPKAVLRRDARVLEARLRALGEGATIRREGALLRASVAVPTGILAHGALRVVAWNGAIVAHACATHTAAKAEAARVRGGLVVRAADAPRDRPCWIGLRPRFVAEPGDLRQAGLRGARVVLRFAPAVARRLARIEHLGVLQDDVVLAVVHADRRGRLTVAVDDPDLTRAVLAHGPLRGAYRAP